MIRKMFAIALIFTFSLSIWGNGQSSLALSKSPPSISAETAALIDVASGRVLYEKEGMKRMRIASLTKIMTAIVAIENGNLDAKVKVSQNAIRAEGSSIYLKLGEEMPLNDMLYGLMLRSGNDSAVAIAEHVGGSIEGFAYLMNEKAQSIGMAGTHFMNPHGLDDKEHYSTARDMAILTAYALHNPIFQSIVKTKVKTVPSPGETWDTTWRNKNKMLSLYEGADGVKTGYTKLARRTLASSATRDGVQLAVVVLNDGNDWVDSMNLMNWGFEQFKLTKLIQKRQAFSIAASTQEKQQVLVAGEDFKYPLADGEETAIKREIILYPEQSTNAKLGVRGKIKVYLDDKMIGSVPLVAENSPRLKWSDHRYSFLTFGSDQSITSFTQIISSIWKIWVDGMGK